MLARIAHGQKSQPALAMLGLAAAAGLSSREATLLANVTAGLEVERWGVAPVSLEEITRELTRLSESREGVNEKRLNLEEAAAVADRYRQQDKTVVFTNGCFDLLHVGHVTYLEQARGMGDVLIVAINSDRSIRGLKGLSRPVIDQEDRARMLASLSCVNHVLIFDEGTPHDLLEAIRPDILVKGGTYTIDEVVGREVVEAYGGSVTVTGQIDGVSTTDILQHIAERSR